MYEMIQRRHYQKKKHHNKWVWFILVPALAMIVGTGSYFAIRLSHINRESSTQVKKPSHKVIKVGTNAIEDDQQNDNQNLDSSSQTSSSSSSAASSQSSQNNNQQRIPDLKTMTVCGCLLAEPNWFKSSNVSYSANGQTGTVQDNAGNKVQVTWNSVDAVTITVIPANGNSQTRQVPPVELYNDYYNAPNKQNEVNDYVDRLN